MSKNLIIGNEGERAAQEYLKNKSYTILATNWRFGKYELDIIAEINNTLVIVEVKTLTGTYFQQPFQNVTKKKQKFIIKAANAYIEKFEIDYETRFDIISIVLKNEKFYIEHIEDAFYPLL